MKLELVVPVAPSAEVSSSLSDGIASVAGKTIGLWHNEWRSYEAFLARVSALFERQGAKAIRRFSNLPFHGMQANEEITAIAGQIDTALVGLGA